jgi:integrase
MGRRRKSNLHLPPKLYLKGFSYYYVSENKWTWLSKDEPTALRLWAMLEGKVHAGTSVDDLVQGYLAHLAKQRELGRDGALALGTLTQYTSFARSIKKQFPGLAQDLNIHEVNRWKETVGKVWFNGSLALMRGAYRWGITQELVDENPLRDVEHYRVAPRPRYITDDEFQRIHGQATLWLKIAMDLSYLTGMRRSDVLALKWNAIDDEAIFVAQIKRQGKVRQNFEVTDEIKAVLEQARGRPIVGLYVVASDKGRPISKHQFNDAWAEARAAAQVEDVHFHDIRGKYATDGEEQGLDVQAGLGHTNRAMTQRYVKAKQIIKAPVLSRNIRASTKKVS